MFRYTECLLVCLCLCVRLAAQPSFEFSISGPTALKVDPGDLPCEQSFDVFLESGPEPGGRGAQGWALSIAAVGVAEITGITTEGTTAAAVEADPPGLRNGGFEKSELSSDGEFRGATSAVVLTFAGRVELPVEAKSRVAIVEVQLGNEGDNEGEADASLEFVDGLRGTGGPVNNAVTWQGMTVVPTLRPFRLRLVVADDADCFTTSEGLFLRWDSDDAEVSPTRGRFDAEVRAFVPPGGGRAKVFAQIESRNLEPGVRGWSLSCSGPVVSATVSGTAGDRSTNPPGLRDQLGFEKTEIVDPLAFGGQGPGAVTAVVLARNRPINLEPNGASRVLAVEVEGSAGDTARLVFRDGLRGVGSAVNNMAMMSNQSFDDFLCAQEARIVFEEAARVVVGNANDDAQVDIADVIWILDGLFRDGAIELCPQVTDVNRDRTLNVADPVFLLEYLFFGTQSLSGRCERLIEDALCSTISTVCEE
ncbi:MAG: hypothetical protein AAF488_10590 [Planctomycetota bacterium]